MSPIRHFDHVGITVTDLDTVTAFFAGLGLEAEGRTVLEGEFPDTVTGMPDARTEIVMLRPPGRGTGLELSGFIRPEHEPGSPGPMHSEMSLPQCELRRSPHSWLPGSLSFVVPIGAPSSVQRRRLW